jgi:ribosomal protein L29
MKIDQLKDLDTEQLQQKLKSINETLALLKLQVATHQSTNTAELGKLRHQRAQVKMLISQAS